MTWILTGPDGQRFEADSALKCAGLESASRIGEAQRVANLMKAVDGMLAYDAQLKEARRLLSYAITYSNGRHLFSSGFLADANKLLAEAELECP